MLPLKHLDSYFSFLEDMAQLAAVYAGLQPVIASANKNHGSEDDGQQLEQLHLFLCSCSIISVGACAHKHIHIHTNTPSYVILYWFPPKHKWK